MTDHGDKRHIGRKLRILNPKAWGLPSCEQNNCYEILTAGYSGYRIDRPTNGDTYLVVYFKQIDEGHAAYINKPSHGKHNVGRKIRILNPGRTGIRCEEDATFEIVGMTDDISGGMYQLPKGPLDLMRGVPWHVKPNWFESGFVEWVEEGKAEEEEEKVEGKLIVPEHGEHNVGRTMIMKANGDRHTAEAWDGFLYRGAKGSALASARNFEDGLVRWEEKTGEDIILVPSADPLTIRGGGPFVRYGPKECQSEHGEHNVGRTLVTNHGYEWSVTEWDWKRRIYDCHDRDGEHGAIWADSIGGCKNFNWKEEPSCDRPEHGEHNVDRILVNESGDRRRVNGWNPTRVHPAYYDTRDDKGYARAHIKAADIGHCGKWRWLEDAPASWTDDHGEHNVGRTVRFRRGAGFFRATAWDQGTRFYTVESDRIQPDIPLLVSAAQFDGGDVLWGDPVAKPLKDITRDELAVAYAKVKERERGYRDAAEAEATGPGWYWGRMSEDDEWQPVKTMTGEFGDCWEIGAKLHAINEDGQHDVS